MENVGVKSTVFLTSLKSGKTNQESEKKAANTCLMELAENCKQARNATKNRQKCNQSSAVLNRAGGKPRGEKSTIAVLRGAGKVHFSGEG